MGDALGALFGLSFAIAAFAGWVNHLFVCFGDGQWGFLIAGALFFPIAVIHGWGNWFGWW